MFFPAPKRFYCTFGRESEAFLWMRWAQAWAGRRITDGPRAEPVLPSAFSIFSGLVSCKTTEQRFQRGFLAVFPTRGQSPYPRCVLPPALIPQASAPRARCTLSENFFRVLVCFEDCVPKNNGSKPTTGEGQGLKRPRSCPLRAASEYGKRVWRRQELGKSSLTQRRGACLGSLLVFGPVLRGDGIIWDLFLCFSPWLIKPGSSWLKPGLVSIKSRAAAWGEGVAVQPFCPFFPPPEALVRGFSAYTMPRTGSSRFCSWQYPPLAAHTQGAQHGCPPIVPFHIHTHQGHRSYCLPRLLEK